VSLAVRYVTRDEANAAVRRWHRHHKPVRAHYFAAGAYDGDRLAGVIIVGQPVAPALCNGLACEVVRLACDGETPHAASLLLGAAWRAARALGFRRAVSYTRVDESGTCYHAAGWRRVARVKGRDWDNDAKPGRWLSLDGATLFEPATETVDRWRWEIGPDASPAAGRAT